MKVWLATEGSYSDYSVEGVFSSEEKAKAFMGAFPGGDWNDVTVWEVDQVSPDIESGRKPYCVRMDREGNTVSVKVEKNSYGYTTYMYNDVNFDVHGNIYCYVWAKDEQHAIKITNERRIMTLANNEWIK